MLRSARINSAFCTKFGLNHVQSAENNTRIFPLLGIARTT
ncbi:hypothetical protein HMPREF1580_00920 [Gardnerella vaginalis JCP8070]|nr:hypothetical protein HMPREF1582_01464 [Gardnerella vaginalis JCP8151A]EPI45069.1 hypothetical protein HMPREF1583_01431 [Gardnerella vaginalis JCP8151B]EPI58979.1 hypothetical protein HMPREF1579_01047 [Gardnerella vaginalis JCP8066]EPI59248.1 hypothetical protein HMPREF1580_00920 [Gardnerella vaginalis JCP8070]